MSVNLKNFKILEVLDFYVIKFGLNGIKEKYKTKG